MKSYLAVYKCLHCSSVFSKIFGLGNLDEGFNFHATILLRGRDNASPDHLSLHSNVFTGEQPVHICSDGVYGILHLVGIIEKSDQVAKVDKSLIIRYP